jgi:hypothetical protein
MSSFGSVSALLPVVMTATCDAPATGTRPVKHDATMIEVIRRPNILEDFLFISYTLQCF